MGTRAATANIFRPRRLLNRIGSPCAYSIAKIAGIAKIDD
jgi:hypothetical protein